MFLQFNGFTFQKFLYAGRRPTADLTYQHVNVLPTGNRVDECVKTHLGLSMALSVRKNVGEMLCAQQHHSHAARRGCGAENGVCQMLMCHVGNETFRL